MELWRANDVMVSPVKTIESQVSINKLAKLLLDTNHNSFPVVKYEEDTKSEVVYGLVSRFIHALTLFAAIEG